MSEQEPWRGFSVGDYVKIRPNCRDYETLNYWAQEEGAIVSPKAIRAELRRVYKVTGLYMAIPSEVDSTFDPQEDDDEPFPMATIEIRGTIWIDPDIALNCVELASPLEALAVCDQDDADD